MRGRRRTRIVARVDDGTAAVSVTWFNQPWLADRLKPGTRGQAARQARPLRLRAPLVRHRRERAPPPTSLRSTRPRRRSRPRPCGASSTRRCRSRCTSPIRCPAELREREGLALKRDALAAVHRPRDLDEAETRPAASRLRGAARPPDRDRAPRRQSASGRSRPALGEPGELIHRYREALPFALTPYQEQAIREIDGDLARTVPMQRLLQGDVGSGKTVVALYALLRAVENGRQGALMAPTETLAEQHFLTIADLCLELGVSCALLTSSSGKREREAALGADVVVGHARADPGGLRATRPRGRGRRRAAPLRRRAALGACGRPRAARPPHDRDADPAHARAHGLRRPRRVGDREAARVAQAGDHELDHRGPRVRGVHAADAAAAGGAAGVRRLPADRGVRDVARARRRGGGRAAAARRAARLPRRLPPRPAQGGRAPRAHGPLQGARARRPRGDDGDRGRRRRPERDRDDRAGGRPLRARAAPPAARPGRARRRAVVLPARLAREGGADRVGAGPARRRSATRATASSSPRSTSSCAAAARCSARGSRASPTSASPTSAATATCSSGPAPRRPESAPGRCRTRPRRSSPRSSPRRSREARGPTHPSSTRSRRLAARRGRRPTRSVCSRSTATPIARWRISAVPRDQRESGLVRSRLL